MKINQREIVELKSIITKVKNLLQGFKSRFENVEEKKSLLEGRITEIIKSEKQKENTN